MKKTVTLRYGLELIVVSGIYHPRDKETNTFAYFELRSAILDGVDIFPFLECTETGGPLIEEIENDAVDLIQLEKEYDPR